MLAPQCPGLFADDGGNGYTPFLNSAGFEVAVGFIFIELCEQGDVSVGIAGKIAGNLNSTFSILIRSGGSELQGQEGPVHEYPDLGFLHRNFGTGSHIDQFYVHGKQRICFHRGDLEPRSFYRRYFFGSLHGFITGEHRLEMQFAFGIRHEAVFNGENQFAFAIGNGMTEFFVAIAHHLYECEFEVRELDEISFDLRFHGRMQVDGIVAFLHAEKSQGWRDQFRGFSGSRSGYFGRCGLGRIFFGTIGLCMAQERQKKQGCGYQ